MNYVTIFTIIVYTFGIGIILFRRSMGNIPLGICGLLYSVSNRFSRIMLAECGLLTEPPISALLFMTDVLLVCIFVMVLTRLLHTLSFNIPNIPNQGG